MKRSVPTRDALNLEVRNDVLADAFHWVTASTPGQDVAIVRAQGYGEVA